jgi:hypothetical protein
MVMSTRATLATRSDNMADESKLKALGKVKDWREVEAGTIAGGPAEPLWRCARCTRNRLPSKRRRQLKACDKKTCHHMFWWQSRTGSYDKREERR